MTQELDEKLIAAKGRQIDSERWELPERYRLDPKKLALPPEQLQKEDPELYARWQAIQEDQKRLAAAAAMPFGQMSPQDAERARSVTIAEHLHRTADHIAKQASAILTSGAEGNLSELRAAHKDVLHQLAERYAIIGRYDLAVETEPDEQYRKYYIAVLEAVWRDDDEWCNCEPLRGSGQFSDMSVSRQYVKEEIFSVKTGKPAFLLACSGCPMLNVSDLPPHLQQQRSHRARAHQLAGKLTMEEAARTLQQHGHTTVKLLR